MQNLAVSHRKVCIEEAGEKKKDSTLCATKATPPLPLLLLTLEHCLVSISSVVPHGT